MAVKYRLRKTLEAIQFLNDQNDLECMNFCPQMEYNSLCKSYIVITKKWDRAVREGDWIVKEEDGSFCVCSDDFFNKTYVRIES